MNTVITPVKSFLSASFRAIVMCLYTVRHALCAQYHRWLAQQRKRRSLLALAQLDDYLLKDMGFERIEGQIVRLGQSAPVAGELVRNHRRKVRLRCHFLVRRRQRLRGGR